MRRLALSVAIALLGVALPATAQRNVPVPEACTPQVNARLAHLIDEGRHDHADNVMACGITVSPSRHQRGYRHGNHEILPLRVTMPGGNVRLVEVVINDDLDGIVTAPARVQVFAFG